MAQDTGTGSEQAGGTNAEPTAAEQRPVEPAAAGRANAVSAAEGEAAQNVAHNVAQEQSGGEQAPRPESDSPPQTGALVDESALESPESSEQLADEQDEEEDEEALTYPRFEVGARLIAGAEWRKDHPEADGQADYTSRQPFFFRQARVKLRAELNDRIYMSFSADLEGKPPIRSAFLDAKFKRYLRFRVGRFKRPISRIELTSVGVLPFPDRGIFNSALIERAGWGDRALGMMIHGKLKKPKLRYYAAVMNAAPTIDEDLLQRLRGVDVLGRVEYRPIKGLTFAVNGGRKSRESRVDGPNLSLLGVGGDVELKLGAFKAVAEVLAAQNPYPPSPPLNVDRKPWALVTMGYATYDMQLSEPAVLQPVVACEWVDTDMDVAQDEALRLLVGVNLLWLSNLRVMPRVEIVRPLGEVGDRSHVASELYSLTLSLAL